MLQQFKWKKQQKINYSSNKMLSRFMPFSFNQPIQHFQNSRLWLWKAWWSRCRLFGNFAFTFIAFQWCFLFVQFVVFALNVWSQTLRNIISVTWKLKDSEFQLCCYSLWTIYLTTEHLKWFWQLQSCFIKWHQKERRIKLRIDNGGRNYFM